MLDPIASETLSVVGASVDFLPKVPTSAGPRNVAVCICTYRRPHLLARLLKALEAQETENLFTFAIVVVDNDEHRSAELCVAQNAETMSVSIQYRVEPRRNIALARNKAIENAAGEFVAFIDDDEYPDRNWLAELLKASDKYQADAVLGPVVPEFETSPPSWVVRGWFFERPNHLTGERLSWAKCRTGNVLLRRRMLLLDATWFRPEFGTGGEDLDFFARMEQRGLSAVWCREAVVHESVPASRCSRKYLLGRALLRGCNSNRRSRGRLVNAAKSLVAVPFYVLSLPVLALVGQHWLMKYLIKICDHASRLLAFVGVNVVTERAM